MADWTEPDVNQYLPGKPFTSAKALASVENPIAIAEAAPGAPKVVTQAFGGGVIFAPILQIGTFPAGYTGIGDVAEFLFHGNITNGAVNNTNLFVRFSNNGGATWGSNQQIGSIDRSGFTDNPSLRMVTVYSTSFAFHVNLITGQYSAVTSAIQSGTLTAPLNVNAIQFVSSAGGILASQLRTIGIATGYRAGTGI